MSYWLSADTAPYSAVSPPTQATQVLAVGARSYRKCVRAIRYTPAVTMVAA